MQMPAPPIVLPRSQRLTHHVEAEQQTNSLDRDKGTQYRFLELVQHLIEGSHGSDILPRPRHCHFQSKAPRRHQHRAQMRFTALTEFYEADRHTEETGNAEGLVVTHTLKMPANPLGT